MRLPDFIHKLSTAEKSVIENNSRLNAYLTSLNKYQPPTPRSWLYENTPPERVLNNWLSCLRQLKTGSVYEQNVYEFDMSQLSKWGPQGGHPPILEARSLLDQSFQNVSARFDPKRVHWDSAILEAIEYFRKYQIGNLRAASINTVVNRMHFDSKLYSNSGWPSFTKRNVKATLAQAIADCTSRACLEFPAIALFRFYNMKLRLVWMFPESENLLESTVVQPMLDSLINAQLPFFTPWIGFDAVKKQITEAYDRGLVVAASDFSSTDAHFKAETSESIFPVVASLLQEETAAVAHDTILRMHNIPLVISKDLQCVGSHGVSSGSSWTNLIETIFDIVFGYYVSRSLHRRVEPLFAIGDDMAWTLETYDERFPMMLESLGNSVGQDINKDKTYNYPDKVKTLQRLFQKGYRRSDGVLRGVYSTVRALKSSIYPERYHPPKLWSPQNFAIRQFEILENVVDHPLFVEFVTFVCRGNSHLIDFAKLERSEIDKYQRASKLLPGLNSTYNQEKQGLAIADFESIRIARTL